ncbi:MAG: hypothetical protein ABFD18_13900 [Syntrophomonas sp.]
MKLLGYEQKMTISFKKEEPTVNGHLVEVGAEFRGKQEAHSFNDGPFLITYMLLSIN